MEITEAMTYIKTGEAVIFTGAGFSYGATNVQGNNIPDVASLKQEMLKSLELDESTLRAAQNANLKQVSDVYKSTVGSRNFVSFLQEIFSVKKPTEIQKQIAQQPWKGVFTTNYDNLFELITSKKAVSATESSTIPADDSSVVVHINGALSDLDAGNVEDGIMLTNGSYIRNSFIGSPLDILFTDLVRSAKAVFLWDSVLVQMKNWLNCILHLMLRKKRFLSLVTQVFLIKLV